MSSGREFMASLNIVCITLTEALQHCNNIF
jgi:hypothetical protein